jgi:hypothetical protein
MVKAESRSMTDPIGQLVYRLVDRFRVRYWNPTRDWPATALSQLSYDMRHCALNGFRVDARFEVLRPLGSADWFSRSGPSLDLYYYRLGLIVGLWDKQVTSFEVIVDPKQCPDRAAHSFAPGRVTLVTLTERRRDLTRTTTEAEVLDLLGAPAETGPVLDQRVHTFIAAGNFIDTYHDPSTGRLVRIEFAEARRDSAPAAA